MSYKPRQTRRRSIRLQNYDYSQAGVYFVTVCTRNKECSLGEIIDSQVHLNELGRKVRECWLQIPYHFPNVQLDAFVIMPNHVHGIVVINVGAQHAVPLQRPELAAFGKSVPASLPVIVRSFKSAVAKRLNESLGIRGHQLWQRNYYEHIVRKGGDLDKIRRYILENPAKWEEDEENPNRP